MVKIDKFEIFSTFCLGVIKKKLELKEGEACRNPPEAITFLTARQCNIRGKHSLFISYWNRTEFLLTLDLSLSLNSIMQIKISLPEILNLYFRYRLTEILVRGCKSKCERYTLREVHRSSNKHDTKKLYAFSILTKKVSS